MPYVDERWLGGMLTNFKTSSSRSSASRIWSEAMMEGGSRSACPRRKP
jgi:ribosomal protein S2